LKKKLNLWIDGYNPRAKKMLNQPLDFPGKDKIETMNRLAIIERPQIVETTVRFSNCRKIESMNRLAIIEGQKIVESKARFSNENYG